MSQLTAKQLQAVSGIAKGLPISQIAKSLDVSPRTVQRWEKLPQFATALGQVQHEVSCRIKAESVENATTITCRLENYSAKIS
ncbi:MAG TPA: helix-turn-helix domain-containing protein [Candidatus Sericytochromatia bacterium]